MLNPEMQKTGLQGHYCRVQAKRKNEENWKEKAGRYISTESKEDLSKFWSCPKTRFYLDIVLLITGAVHTGTRQPPT